ncbi:hypothetical protein F5Y03DRAFT_347727 [Xylaria venustula]|nr:hypothetical protein F5Y03DRAFT_347727 [Xylaria venustula]
MAPGSTALTVAAGASILASGWAAGMSASLSVLGIPTILHGSAPTEYRVRQWYFQFLRGQAIIPGLGFLNALNYWNVAYQCWSRGVEWRGFAVAGLSTFFMIPYTLTFIRGTNRKLFAAAEGEKENALSDGEARSLIKKWGDLNIARAIVPVLGTGLALWNFCL